MTPKDTSTITITITDAMERTMSLLGSRLTAMTPDALAAAISTVEWAHLPDWEELDDVEIAKTSALDKMGLKGQLLIITEASYGKGNGAFLLDASDLMNFINEHLGKYRECFFNGDVVIVELEGKHVWLFHHEGHWALADVA
ncbi:MAG: hypothetical protein MJE77_23100 [Proteobacteria bacterium]|nr:hypothetical protein [Pseudomonadota bacterium]